MAAGDYDIAEQLHEGGASQVFRGIRRTERVAVILKVVRRERSDAGAWARLEREAELMRRCAGPAVPEILGLERWGQSPVLVLADGGGESLHRFRARRPELSLQVRLELGLGICDALARAMSGVSSPRRSPGPKTRPRRWRPRCRCGPTGTRCSCAPICGGCTTRATCATRSSAGRGNGTRSAPPAPRRATTSWR